MTTQLDKCSMTFPPLTPHGPPAAAPRSGGRWYRLGPCYLVLAAATIALTFSTYTTEAEFGRHPDEAGHFITGTLVHDWLADGGHTSPLQFGREYYARYPKVALGHWPPLFYAVQGVWYSVFGVSRLSTLWLIAVTGGAFVLLLFECLRRRLGLAVGLAAALLVVAGPVFRYDSSLFMADLLLAVLGFAAAWSFARFLERGTAGAALGFGAFGAAAILTKQDALWLPAVPVVSVVLLRRWDLLRNWRLYASLALVFAAVGAVFYMTHSFTRATWDGLDGPKRLDKVTFLASGLWLGGWASIALAAAGAAALLPSFKRITALGTLPVVLAAQACGLATVQLASPVSLDPRYKTALLPLAALLAGVALYRLASLPRLSAALRLAAVVGVTALVAWGLPAQTDRSVSGYRELVETFEDRPGVQVVLVCSDSEGDGAVVAEFRLQHPAHKCCVLRADKMLASATWMGRHYQLNPDVDTPEKLDEYLVRQPVHFLILDDWEAVSEKRAHADLLRQLVTAHPERFALVRTCAVRRHSGDHTSERPARVYRVVATEDTHPAEVEVRIAGLPTGELIRVGSADSHN